MLQIIHIINDIIFMIDPWVGRTQMTHGKKIEILVMLLKKQRSKDSSLSDGKQMEIEIENVYM